MSSHLADCIGIRGMVSILKVNYKYVALSKTTLKPDAIVPQMEKDVGDTELSKHKKTKNWKLTDTVNL